VHALFQSPVSQHLDDNKQTLLHNLVIEAPQKTITALEKWLNSPKLNEHQRRYVLDCLKTIGTPEALQAIKNADKTKMDKSSREYAEDIISEAAAKIEPYVQIPGQKDLETLDSFRNPLEGGVEYIKIPGGTYNYSVTGKMETVPKMLPLNKFSKVLLTFAGSIDRYADYLGTQTEKWQETLGFIDVKGFNGDDQPVVDVTWYAARAYCFWLSCLDAVLKGDKRLEDIRMLSDTYRLPTEVEWEWAAGGNPDGSMRTYPWTEDKGEPNPNLANFNKNVGATTPVGRYPEGATPHGLMDMAGNVEEWMENRIQEYIFQEYIYGYFRAIRGGSWYGDVFSLRCAKSSGIDPVGGGVDWGFRVVRPQS
jgi:hypothetical protein